MITYEVRVNGGKMLETSDLDVAKDAARSWSYRHHSVSLYEITTKEIEI